MWRGKERRQLATGVTMGTTWSWPSIVQIGCDHPGLLGDAVAGQWLSFLWQSFHLLNKYTWNRYDLSSTSKLLNQASTAYWMSTKQSLDLVTLQKQKTWSLLKGNTASDPYFIWCVRVNGYWGGNVFKKKQKKTQKHRTCNVSELTLEFQAAQHSGKDYSLYSYKDMSLSPL